MKKTSYWPNNPLFIFQFMFLPILISVVDLYMLYAENLDPIRGLATIIVFMSLVVSVIYSHRVVINNKVISGPGRFRIIHAEDIPIDEAEITMKKRFFICPYLVIKHKKSNKEIYVAQMDFTEHVIEDIKNIIKAKNN